jgi:D-sedoheptulose 7-phosphate isomerase
LKEYIGEQLRQSLSVMQSMVGNDALITIVQNVAQTCVDALRNGNKILFAGNGGSAADAQHLAGELVSRFAYDRPGLPAFALTTDTSVLTAIGNDYGYQRVFARQIEAVGKAGDVLFGITTSGRSPNIHAAITQAKSGGLVTVGMTGSRVDAEPFRLLCDHCIQIPAQDTPKIQEGHIVIGHIICGLIETACYPR